MPEPPGQKTRLSMAASTVQDSVLGKAFFHKKEGEYTLGGRSGPPTAGRYKLVPHDGTFQGSGKVIDEHNEIAGIFQCWPISPEPLPKPSEFATQEIRSVSVITSEIMREIGDSKNDKAYFVLPSQLNGAEYPSHTAIVNTIEQYKTDNTGGPRGQLAAHPAAGQAVLDNAANDRRQKGINAVDKILEKLEKKDVRGFVLTNGYLTVPNLSSASQFEIAQDVWEKYSNMLRPLIMKEVPATGLNPSKSAMNTQNKHRVNLVYASAVPVNTYNNGYQGDRHTQLVNYVAHKVLQAQYYGALYEAAYNQDAMVGGKVKVYLMPLGGGVFRNDSDSIARAISEAVEMLTADLRERLDIRLLGWEGNTESSQFRDLLEKYKKLKR